MVVEYLNISGNSGHTFFFLQKQQSAAKGLDGMEMNGSKIKTVKIILSWSPGQTQSCRVVKKTQLKKTRRLQKTFGNVVFVVIIIRTRSADQGGNKSGNGSEIRKDCAQRFGVCNELIKSVPDLENTSKKRLW